MLPALCCLLAATFCERRLQFNGQGQNPLRNRLPFDLRQKKLYVPRVGVRNYSLLAFGIVLAHGSILEDRAPRPNSL